ncbi:MAG: hypothetical protein IJM41_00635 [Bacteroidales bacterium]|nr:hypothetical protein [Bacteroidales bacterium]
MSDDLFEILAWLDVARDDDEVVSALQGATAELLLRYAIKSYGLTIYPLELESYYWRKDLFEDPYVHLNPLQQNRFGHFFIHRSGRSADSPYNRGLRACASIVLSDTDDYYYSVLIRSAVFSDGVACFGPNNVLRHILSSLKVPEDQTEAFYRSVEERSVLFDLESASVLSGDLFATQMATQLDPREKTPLVFAGRVGLGGRSPRFRNMPLRAVVGSLDKEHLYKDKRALLARLRLLRKSSSCKGNKAAASRRGRKSR